MKALLVTECPIDVINGKPMYALSTFIKRYSCFGNLIVCAYASDPDISGPRLPSIPNVSFVLIKKENSPSNIFPNKRYNVSILKKLIKDCDLVIAHLPSPVGNHAIRIARQLGIPVFSGVVGCAFEALWYYNWKGRIMSIPYYLGMKKSLRISDYAFYVSQEYLQRRYPCPGPTFGASNVEIPCLDEAILDGRIRHIEDSTINSDGTVKLATLGAVNVPYKGFQYVIKAVSELNKSNGPKFHYYCVGGGDQNRLKALAETCGVGEYVHFTGLLTKDGVNELLDSVDVYIHPSLTEGIPRSIIEAQSRAVPVLASDIPACRELLNDDFLFRAKSVRSIVSKLKKLNKEMLLRGARYGFKNAEQYTADVLNKRRNDFYARILEHI